MKRQLAFILFISLFAACVIWSTLIVAGCGGGGGGGGGDGGVVGGGGLTPLATGTFTKTEDLGSDGAWSSPFVLNPQVREQHLFFAQDIKGSGYIESFSLRYDENDPAVSINCPDVTIKMGHTSLSALTTTFANNVEQGRGSLVTVLAGAVTIPAGSPGDYFTITLDQPFQYNGVDNLVVEFVRTVACDNNIDLDSTEVVYTDVSLQNPNSGAATGTLYPNYPNAKFTFAGGDNAVSYTGTQVNWFTPFTDTPGAGRRVQSIYPASDIDGSGPITGIAIPVSAITSAGSFTVTVKLGHSTATELTSTGPPVDDAVFAGNYSDNPVTVVDAAILNVPAGVPAGDYVWLPLNGDVFPYNGVDSLVMEIRVSSPSGSFGWKTHTTPGTNTSLFESFVEDGLREESFDAKFRFHGEAIIVMPTGNSFSGQVLGGVNPGGQIQSLYRSSDLGTAATISSVSVRLDDDSVATTLTNYKLYMGHTIKTAFDTADSYASNMDGSALVYSGILEVPAGLKAGDWLTIPLQTSFDYDVTKNLSILFTTDVGSVGDNSVTASYANPRYVNHSVGRNDNAVDISGNPTWGYDGIVDLQLGITK